MYVMDNELEYIPYFFATASQVKYYDPELQAYAGGLALGEQLVKGPTGETVDINEYTRIIAEQYAIPRDDVVITLAWNNISAAILW